VLELKDKMLEERARNDFWTLKSKLELGQVLALSEPSDMETAEAMLQEALEGLEACPEAPQSDVLAAKLTLANVLNEKGQAEDKERAERMLREVVKGYEDLYHPTHPEALHARVFLAGSLLGRKEYGEALQVLGPVERWVEALGPGHPRTREAVQIKDEATAGLKGYEEEGEVAGEVGGSAEAPRHGLIGRQAELKQVLKALEKDKKVAIIVGNPGEGKSRIAAEAASLSKAICAFLDLSGT
jgi:ATP-dependent Clp protease ATP-binding subunit ClpA